MEIGRNGNLNGNGRGNVNGNGHGGWVRPFSLARNVSAAAAGGGLAELVVPLAMAYGIAVISGCTVHWITRRMSERQKSAVRPSIADSLGSMDAAPRRRKRTRRTRC